MQPPSGWSHWAAPSPPFFILAANSWMQNPVGYAIDPVTHRSAMHDFLAVLLNPVLLVTFPHTMFGAYLTGGLFVLGVSGYHLLRRNEVELFGRAARIALIWSFVSAILLAFSGHARAQIMTQVQPMKMAAAEALYQTARGAPFSVFAIGMPDGKHLVFDATLPHLLSVLATNTWVADLGQDRLRSRGRVSMPPQSGLVAETLRQSCSSRSARCHVKPALHNRR